MKLIKYVKIYKFIIICKKNLISHLWRIRNQFIILMIKEKALFLPSLCELYHRVAKQSMKASISLKSIPTNKWKINHKISSFATTNEPTDLWHWTLTATNVIKRGTMCLLMKEHRLLVLLKGSNRSLIKPLDLAANLQETRRAEGQIQLYH